MCLNYAQTDDDSLFQISSLASYDGLLMGINVIFLRLPRLTPSSFFNPHPLFSHNLVLVAVYL